MGARNKRILVSWVAPILAAVTVFLIARPAFAQLATEQANLAQYLTANNVEVGSEAGENGFRQIYYVWQGQKHFITNSAYTNGEPDSQGEYITWMGQSASGAWQIFLYHIPTETIIQISSSQNNANSKVDKNGKVVWEGWAPDETGGKWQVFFFDGTKVIQMTFGDLSMNPDIDGDYIAYGRRDITGTWRAVLYSISKKEAKDITVGIGAKKPKVRGNKIVLAGTGDEEEFPLTIDDLFLLDLVPLTATTSATLSAPETVSEEEIEEELQATQSASPVETIPPEPSPNPTQ